LDVMGGADLSRALNANDAETDGRSYDAIVVGAGAAGGLAACLLCEAGLRVLLLDAGYRFPIWRQPGRWLTHTLVRSVADPRLLAIVPPRLINAGRKALRLVGRVRQPIQTQCFAWERLPNAFVDDRDFPYEAPARRPFTWIRAHGVGGRMVIPGHGRQYYRLGRSELAPRDGLSPPWPLADGELDPWYVFVEKRLGLAGARDGLESPPDSEIARPLQPNDDEASAIDAIRTRWPEAHPILGRYAPPLQSVAAATATGRLSIRSGALVQAVKRDVSGRIDGCEWYDLRSKSRRRASAPVVFLCASALESTRILLQSKDLPAKPGVLGHYLMDHMLVKAEGVGSKLSDEAEVEPGRCLYLPRFDLRDGEASDADRGFGVQLYRSWAGERSWFTATAFCEVAPRAENRVMLSSARRDAWGNPALHVDFHYSEAEHRLAEKAAAALEELAEVVGAKLHTLVRTPATPGTSVHECGTARMGNDPANSVLNSHNSYWDVPGLYVTDGASFPSQGAQNPTLTIMALTARACHHALR
jgi:choline dehydrogenase-like flavoprotein